MSPDGIHLEQGRPSAGSAGRTDNASAMMFPMPDPDSANRFSVAFPRQWWYPAARSVELGRQPLAITLMDARLAVFRSTGGHPVALVDRCAHRNYPLSLGRVTSAGTLECGYHGWCYDGAGRCVHVPGMVGGIDPDAAPRRVDSHAAVERDGIVWVWGEPGTVPTRAPFALPKLDGAPSRIGEVVFRHDLDCTMHAAIENALDVPHTAFLHRGIFRGGTPRRITAERRPLSDGVEVQYLGEPVGMGPVRLTRTESTFDHWDRFFLPSIAQIEYAVEGWCRIVNTILHLPLSPFRTRAWFVVRFASRLPARVVAPIVLLQGRQILRQDARGLARQTENIRTFGGERFASTELDLLGMAIWHLLRHAERSERAAATDEPTAADGVEVEITERTITFEA